MTVCPDGTFASDDVYRCWSDCPTTSLVHSGKKIFRDYTNKKCVQNCPSTEPYADETTRRCYSTCPSPRYASNATEMRCVTVCPHPKDSSSYETYGHLGACVDYCPSGFWADPATATCIADCNHASYPYNDNSTGIRICVATCPYPNHFADTSTNDCV